MNEWNKKTYRLDPRHTWKARPGYQIFVSDRGAVRFEYPCDWIFKPTDDALHFLDAAPPNDECRLAFSYHLVAAEIDWSQAPLEEMLREVGTHDPRKLTVRRDAATLARHGLRLVWMEHQFTDPQGGRPALTRTALAFRFNIQVLLTFDFWPYDLRRCGPVWEYVLDSLRIGEYLENPTLGPA